MAVVRVLTSILFPRHPLMGVVRHSAHSSRPAACVTRAIATDQRYHPHAQFFHPLIPRNRSWLASRKPLRLAIIDGHITNWTEAEVLNGGPIVIVLGYGLPQLVLQRAAYQTLVAAIIQLEGDLPALRAERDGIWGISPQDDDGVWFRLTQYKALVRARMGAKHPLSRTVPNFGDLNISRYLTVVQQFIDHWERVNAALLRRR